MIPQGIIDEIKEKANIVNIISSYVALKKKGKNHLGLCPFHSEKTPSFVVSEEKGIFHCFGCGEGGNIFSFIMKLENVDFLDAVEIVGEKVGVHVEKSGLPKKDKTINDRFYLIMETASKFYESNISNISEYLQKRAITSQKTFRLGYALNEWDSLLKFMVSKGISEEDLEKTGLVLRKSDGKGFYDRFRNRLIFPITDYKNNVIGFSGRAISDEEPKYLNSPDSPIFLKGNNLYNLANAKEEIKKQKFALLVEGNVDVVSCFQSGFKNVIAPLGTALTINQAKLLKRYSDMVVIAFDSDSSGVSAAERAQEVFKEAKINVRIAEIKGAKDPDELIKNSGKEAFFECINKSIPALEFKLRRIFKRFSLTDREGRSMAAHESLSILSKEEDQILKGEYLKLVSETLNIPLDTLNSELKALSSFKAVNKSLKRVTEKPSSKIVEAEKTLIRLMIEWEEALPKIKDELAPENFIQYGDLVKKLWESPASYLLDNSTEKEEDKILREIMLKDEPLENREQILADCIKTLKAEDIRKQIEGLKFAIIKAEKEGQIDLVGDLNREYLNLNEILRSLMR